MNPNFTSQLSQTFATSLGDLSTIFIAFLPRLIWAFLILIIGLVLAKWAKSLTQKALRAINLSPLLHKFGINQVTTEGDVRPQFELVVSEVVRWFIIYLFLISVFTVLGINSIAEFMQNILSYVPNILTAAIIFLLAVILAGFAESFVKNALSSFDLVTSRLMGKIASYTVVVIGSLIALTELGIAEYFINILFIGFVLTLSLAIGLSFGLGSKDLIQEILHEWYHRYTTTHRSASKNRKKSKTTSWKYIKP